MIAVGAAALAGALTLSACENKSSVTAEPENAPTVGDGTTDAGSQLQEEAAQVGQAIEAGAKEVAQEVDQATDNLAAEAKEAEADTAAEAQQDNATKQ
jgi:hypothetical protein